MVPQSEGVAEAVAGVKAAMMMAPKSHLRNSLLAIGCVLALLLLADEYPAMRYRGDGNISGGPVFGYSIKMSPIPFYQPGEYAFHFRGAPDEEWALRLYLKGKVSDNRQALTDLRTIIATAVVDGKGNTVCQASGLLAETEYDWQTVELADGSALSHQKCLRVRLSPRESYTLTVRIRNADPRTPQIQLEPVFEGGEMTWP